MEIDCHHVACVCDPNLHKKFFFSKLGKKSPKFHWEWGQILAPENTKNSLKPLSI